MSILTRLLAGLRAMLGIGRRIGPPTIIVRHTSDADVAAWIEDQRLAARPNAPAIYDDRVMYTRGGVS